MLMTCLNIYCLGRCLIKFLSSSDQSRILQNSDYFQQWIFTAYSAIKERIPYTQERIPYKQDDKVWTVMHLKRVKVCHFSRSGIHPLSLVLCRASSKSFQNLLSANVQKCCLCPMWTMKRSSGSIGSSKAKFSLAGCISKRVWFQIVWIPNL